VGHLGHINADPRWGREKAGRSEFTEQLGPDTALASGRTWGKTLTLRNLVYARPAHPDERAKGAGLLARAGNRLDTRPSYCPKATNQPFAGLFLKRQNREEKEKVR